MILERFPLHFQWQTQEPFLFCVHHLDRYPQGTPTFAPKPELLRGRNLGQDFEPKDGFRMYHGETVPGFPVHPHRGFETITMVRKGLVDHADSMGAAGRYGDGDVQWMTAGRGVQHSEMFPLLRQNEDNTMELFQIWLNLPRARKMAEPDFKMFWNEQIPIVQLPEQKAHVTVIAGEIAGNAAIAPPKASWAADPENQTAIWLIRLEADGAFELPAGSKDLARSLYFFAGSSIEIAGERIPAQTGLFLDGSRSSWIRAAGEPAELLLLQAKRIGEPVVQYGPFVMNSRAEIVQTMQEYQRTEFGGWPWPRADMVHGPGLERFARYPDGRIERPLP